MTKGCNFRPPKIRNVDKAIASIIDGFDKYISFIRNKHNKIDIDFEEWKIAFTSKVRLLATKDSNVHKINYKLMINNKIKDEIKLLQDKYVITSVDKASNNFAIICKKFYIDMIIKEIGFSVPNNTYKLMPNNIDYFIKIYKEYYDKANIKSPSLNDKLPYIHIIPKFHKTPIAFRSIVASRTCISKTLSKMLSKAYKLFHFNLKRYCKAITQSTNLKPNWIIDSHDELLLVLNNLIKQNKLYTVNTYDFEQLYTNLDHKDIFQMLDETVRKGSGFSKRFIKINGYFASWCTSNTSINTYDINQISDMTQFLISNTYFTVGDTVFKQNVGIPMGTDVAPALANIFLFGYEYKYYMNLIKIGDWKNANLLKYTFRYIDDISTINDYDHFENISEDIYPQLA